MSLYGDLPQAKTASAEGSSWASTVPKMQPTLRKPGGMFAPPPSVMKAAAGRGGGRSGPPPAGRGFGRGSSSAPGPASENGPSTSSYDGPSPGPASTAAPTPSNASSSSIFAINGPIMDEYDPMRPNDYEVVSKLREKRKQQAEVEAQKQAQMREMEAEFQRRKQEEDRAQAQIAEDRARAAAHVLALAAPIEQQRQRDIAMSGDDAFMRRGQLGSGRQAAANQSGSRNGEEDESDLEAAGVYFGASEPPSTAAAAAASGNVKGMSFAQRMLEKMGWKEGDGLGKNRQGMSTPLIAQKTDKRSGIIVNASEASVASAKRVMSADVAAPASVVEKKQRMGAFMYGVPSRVLCMRNMVGPGEVDEDLEEEVGNELTKYGNVTSVLIFEVTTPGYTPEEAVRIFVQFDRIESATKAVVDLQARFFGGRTVRVSFFSEQRFDKVELAPVAEEFE